MNPTKRLLVILLISLTIHGHVPDLHNLASLRGLNLVCDILLQQDFFSGDDDLTDDVSGPSCAVTHWR